MNEPIINGIDVSEYFINVIDEGGGTIDYKILPNRERLLVEKILEQNQQLARLQEELDIKEKMLDKFMIGSGETLEKLQKENEKLKEQLNIYMSQYEIKIPNKYRQTLEIIRKEYTNSIFYQCDKTEEECPCHNCIILGQLDRAQNIVKIIDEVLNDRD